MHEVFFSYFSLTYPQSATQSFAIRTVALSPSGDSIRTSAFGRHEGQIDHIMLLKATHPVRYLQISGFAPEVLFQFLCHDED